MITLSKRERIMQVAEKLFADKRLHEVTLSDIVNQARVGKGTIYTYFRDKDDLFFQVATKGFEELCELLEYRVAEDDPFEDQLLQACQAISAFFRKRRHLFRMIQTEDARMSLSKGSLQARWCEKRKQLLLSLGAILERGRAEGLLRSDLSDELLAELFMGLLRARARHLHSEDIELGDKMLVEFFLNGAGQAVEHVSGAQPSTSLSSEVYL